MLFQTKRIYNFLYFTVKSTFYYKCAGCDLEMLFGNMDEVVEVSQKLLTSLEAATKGKEFDEQIVGKGHCTAPLIEETGFI